MSEKNWTSAPVISIGRKDSLRKAIKAMNENNIHILPVMEEDKLVGIIADANLKKALVASDKLLFFIPSS